MKLSELCALPVERIDGKRKGYVIAAIADGVDIKALFCSDEDEREFFVDTADVVRSSQNILYRKEAKKRAVGRAIRLNMPCYDENGRFLGYAVDYTLAKYRLKSCLIEGKSYSAERLCAGDVGILKDKNHTAAAIAAKDMFLEAVVGAEQ